MLGKTLGKYRIVRKLGQGGMGHVYKAIQEGLERDVAVKVLSPNLLANPEMAARFQQEVLISSKLQHKNLIRVYDQGEEDGFTFFAMEYFQGISLQDYLKKHGMIAVDLALRIVAQVVQAIHHVHKEGLIHRDVKPSNVMVNEDGLVKLMDFGLARDGKHSALTQTGALLGTLGYMSPEMIRGDEVDQRSDLYQVGVVLFELITGKLPLEREEVFRVARGDTDIPFRTARTLRPEIPTCVDRFLSNSLTLFPEDRYQKAKDLFRDLVRAEEGKEVIPLGPKGRRSRGSPRRSKKVKAVAGDESVPKVEADAKPDEVFRLIRQARRQRFDPGTLSLWLKALAIAIVGWIVVAGWIAWKVAPPGSRRPAGLAPPAASAGGAKGAALTPE